jgi:hypothetical protein
MEIWEWADLHTTDGNARGVTKAFLDYRAGVVGIGEAMIAVGWLQESEAGLIFPNFTIHNGKSAKTRAQVSNRVSAMRSRNAGGVTKSLPEKRREELKTNPPTPLKGGSNKKKNWGNDVPFSQRPENQHL